MKSFHNFIGTITSKFRTLVGFSRKLTPAMLQEHNQDSCVELTTHHGHEPTTSIREATNHSTINWSDDQYERSRIRFKHAEEAACLEMSSILSQMESKSSACEAKIMSAKSELRFAETRLDYANKHCRRATETLATAHIAMDLVFAGYEYDHVTNTCSGETVVRSGAAAQYIGVAPKSMSRFASKNNIPSIFVKELNRTVYRIVDLDSFLAKKAVDVATAGG